MTAEQLEALAVWLEGQAATAGWIAMHDRSQVERLRAEGRAEAFGTSAQRLRQLMGAP